MFAISIVQVIVLLHFEMCHICVIYWIFTLKFTHLWSHGIIYRENDEIFTSTLTLQTR